MKSEYRLVDGNYVLQLGGECLMIGKKVALLVDLNAGGLIAPERGLVLHGMPSLVQHYYQELLQMDLRAGRTGPQLTYLAEAFPVEELNDVMKCISRFGRDYVVYANPPSYEVDTEPKKNHLSKTGLRYAG
jgi:hypothetical protein